LRICPLFENCPFFFLGVHLQAAHSWINTIDFRSVCAWIEDQISTRYN
jgi:hypothetical protein